MPQKKKAEAKADAFDFKSIKTFENACAKEGLDPKALPDVTMIHEDLRKPIIAAYKLLIIYRAINNGWKPDWSNFNQYKYYPWFRVLSSGFGFDGSDFIYDYTYTNVGSRLCTDSREKALYISETFQSEYKDYFLYPE
jgi:hypothetical protein